MKRIMALLCVLGMFAFVPQSVSAIPTTNINTGDSISIEQQLNGSMIALGKRDKAHG